MIGNLAVVAACIVAAWSLQKVEETVQSIPRIQFSAGDTPLLAEAPVAGEPLNFLLVGADSAARLDEDNSVTNGRDLEFEATRARSDTMMLVRLDPTTGHAWVLSIPRDLWVPIPGFKEEKINAALSRGGPALLVETITSYFDLPIHHYMQVDFAGFAAVVDTIGGVPVYFPNPARDRSSGLSIPEGGCVSLSGSEALGYVRSRKYQEFIDGQWVSIDGRTDLDRGARQRDFMILALEQVVDRTGRNPLEIQRLVSAVTEGGQNIQLDDELSISDLIEIGAAFQEFDPDTLQRYQLPVNFDFIPTGDPAPKRRPANNDGEAGEASDVDVDAELEVEGLDVLRLATISSQPILDIFRGVTGDVRPADVKVIVSQGSAEPQQVADAVDALRERGFEVINSGQVEVEQATTVRFADPGRLSAEILVRYLAGLPDAALISGDSSTIEMVVGSDYNAVRLIPRPEAEIAGLFASAQPLDSSGAGSALDDSSSDDSSSDTSAVEATTSAPPTTVVDEASIDESPDTTLVPVIGQIPEGAPCQ